MFLHCMARSLADLAGNVDIVRSHYRGNVIVAVDRACVPVPAVQR